MTEIVQYYNAILRYICNEVQHFDQQLKQLAEEMLKTMYAYQGIGLAANQIGKYIRLITVNPTANPENKEQELVMVNPKILYANREEKAIEECLSLHNVLVKVNRATEIIVQYQDLKGQKQKQICKGQLARIVQHELDHLDGKLIIDYLPEDQQQIFIRPYIYDSDNH